MDASFTNVAPGTKEKLNRIFTLSRVVHEEMHNLWTDERDLPANLRIKMPEYLNFVENFRQIIVSKGYISVKLYEKKECKNATEMLSGFLYQVLSDNQEIILRQTKLLE